MVNLLDSLDLFLERSAIVVVDSRGHPTPSQSRLNALFQIEKNFSKKVRVREAGSRATKLWGSRLSLALHF
jgi:hypothetical protein